MEGARDRKDLKIHYVETSMTTSMKLAFDDPLDFGRILQHGVLNARKMLNLGPQEGVFDGYANMPVDETTRAGNYKGEFFIHLSESDQSKGFQDQLREVQLEYARIHTSFVDLQEGEGESSELGEVEKLRKEVGVFNRKLEAMIRLNKVLRQENISFKEEVLSLNAEFTSFKAQSAADKVQSAAEKAQSAAEKAQSAAEMAQLRAQLNVQSERANKIYLRIVLEAAHQQLTLRLGRSPPIGTSWSTFINLVTSHEMTSVGVTRKMLSLMATGKNRLNRSAHSAPLAVVAMAVTTMQKQPDTWRSIFQFAYGEDADEIVFEDAD